MTSNTTPYVKVKNVANYIDSLRDRDNNHAVIKNDGSYFYLQNGKEIPGNEWEANNPIPTLQPNRESNGFQLDGRTNWI